MDLADDEKALIHDYRSASPQMREVIRTMANAVRKLGRVSRFRPTPRNEYPARREP